MAGMTLVNNQGSYDDAIWPFAETEWNGISTADMVFPSFLFINGLSIYLAVKPEMCSDKNAWFKILKRVFFLFLIGFLL
jgi:predicted acyltransferase